MISTAKIKEITLFSLLLLSGVAFSIALLVCRIFSPEKIEQMIYFQSFAVFFSFLIQAGLRAEMRNQVYRGRSRVVNQLVHYIRQHISRYIIIIALLLMLQDLVHLCFAFSYLIAYFTLLVGVSIAMRNKTRAALYSFLAFVLVLIGSSIVIFYPIEATAHAYRYVVEIFSVIVIVVVSFLSANEVLNKKRAGQSLKKVIISGISIQLSSFFIYFLGFLLSQYVLMLATYDKGIALIYADMTIFCGVQLLLLSKIHLYMESTLVRKGWIVPATVAILAWSVLVGLGAYYFYRIFANNELAFASILFILAINSRIATSILVQFAQERFKRIANSTFLIISLLLVYGVWFAKQNVHWPIVGLSPLFVSLLLICLAFIYRSNFLIKVKAS